MSLFFFLLLLHLPPYRPIFAFVFGQFPARQIFAPPTRGCRSTTIEILLLLLLSILRTSASSKRVAHFGERERSAITLQVSASFLSSSNFTTLYFSEENFGKKVTLLLLSLTNNSCLFDRFITSAIDVLE